MDKKLQRQADVWEKWEWLWTAIFYGAVLVSAGLMVIDGSRTTPIWVALPLTGILLIWHWFGLRLAYRDVKDVSSWNKGAFVRFIVILGDSILWFVLVNISVAYYLALFGLFGQVFHHLPLRFAGVSATLLAAATIFEQVADTGETFALNDSTIWLFFFIALAPVILGIWVSAIIGQSTRRRELIEQLEAAQAELAAAERREGVLEERQRLSREIHDTLAQGFTSIVMHLEAAEQALPGDLERLQKHLNQARSTARTSLDQARRVVQDLRPDLLEQHSLPDAIKRTTTQWAEETGIPSDATITGDPVLLHPNIEVTLLRATQEALNNIRKHAQATTVQVTLSYLNDLVILDVQDNGVGLNGTTPSPFSGGYGLQAMRERVEYCGGSVTLESEPGEGATLVVSIPLSE